MTDVPQLNDNCKRLLEHLEEGSLAKRLVDAHHGRDLTNPKESMKAVLLDRLAQMKALLDGDAI